MVYTQILRKKISIYQYMQENQFYYFNITILFPSLISPFQDHDKLLLLLSKYVTHPQRKDNNRSRRKKM